MAVWRGGCSSLLRWVEPNDRMPLWVHGLFQDKILESVSLKCSFFTILENFLMILSVFNGFSRLYCRNFRGKYIVLFIFNSYFMCTFFCMIPIKAMDFCHLSEYISFSKSSPAKTSRRFLMILGARESWWFLLSPAPKIIQFDWFAVGL